VAIWVWPDQPEHADQRLDVVSVVGPRWQAEITKAYLSGLVTGLPDIGHGAHNSSSKMISERNEAAQHREPFTWSDFFRNSFQLRELAVKLCNSSGKGPRWDCSAFGGLLGRTTTDLKRARILSE
jgi:hypothetical protein